MYTHTLFFANEKYPNTSDSEPQPCNKIIVSSFRVISTTILSPTFLSFIWQQKKDIAPLHNILFNQRHPNYLYIISYYMLFPHHSFVKSFLYHTLSESFYRGTPALSVFLNILPTALLAHPFFLSLVFL